MKKKDIMKNDGLKYLNLAEGGHALFVEEDEVVLLDQLLNGATHRVGAFVTPPGRSAVQVTYVSEAKGGNLEKVAV